MALKAVHVIDVPTLDQVHELPALSAKPADRRPSPSTTLRPGGFTVIGHRGCGMNSTSSDPKSNAIKENSILSFNAAARLAVPFVEFDVQLTRDGVPVIFHDTFVLTHDSERRVVDLSLAEFLSCGGLGKPLLRRGKDGRPVGWAVDADDSLCTLEEAFGRVSPHLGFNIELKFEDEAEYTDEEIVAALRPVLLSVSAHAGSRPVFFSTFQPDAARLARRMQGVYPVFFLTDGGTERYGDERRNSLEAALELCSECGLEGIVSEARAVLGSPWVVEKVKERGLGLLTYGEVNNVKEVVRVQRMMGVDGVIVDRVEEIAGAAAEFVGRGGEEELEAEWLKRQISLVVGGVVPELAEQ